MWFTETPWPPIALVGGLAVFLFAAWTQNARKSYLAGVAGCLVAGIGFYVLEKAIVTDREQVTARLMELTTAFQKNDAEATLNCFSGTAIKERLLAVWALETVDVDDDLRITDIDVDLKAEGTRAKSHFRANGTIHALGYSGHQPSRWMLTWEKEDGSWKVVEVERLNVVNGESMPIQAAQQ